MTNRLGAVVPRLTAVACSMLLYAACFGSSGGGNTGGTQSSQGGTPAPQAGQSGSGGQAAGSGGNSGGQAAGSGGNSGGQTGGQVAGSGGSGPSAGSPSGGGGQVAGSGGKDSGGTAGTTTGGQAGGGQAGSTGGAAGNTSSCVGKAWPTATPNAVGPFTVAADKKIGPFAGYTPDPIYGDQQQQFNIYRPKNLADSGYCHPILVWANGHTDNPEPNPPLCVVDAAANKWCGTYPGLMNQLASHGFVVIASLSTTTSKGDPLPTIIGLDWLLKQAEDPTSPYYHHLDTAHIGALGHSEGGMSTCKAAADPRISAIATVSGTAAITSIHGPALFFCGAKDTVAKCDGIKTNFLTVKDQPAIFIDNLNADHGSWTGEGVKGPDFTGLTAWFRYHLMGDTANGKMFYGQGCGFCTDNRVTVERNTLMTP